MEKSACDESHSYFQVITQTKLHAAYTISLENYVVGVDVNFITNEFENIYSRSKATSKLLSGIKYDQTY